MEYEKFIQIMNKFGDMKNPCLYRRKIQELESTYNDQFYQRPQTEICLTFKQAWRNLHTDEEIEENVVSFFHDKIIHNELRTLLLIREYGESNNLHFHGIISLKSTSKKNYSSLKSYIGKYFGKTTIKAVRNQEEYFKYIGKEQVSNQETDFIYMESKFT